MKKITALLLVLVMFASALTACGSAKDKESDKAEDTTVSTVEKEDGKKEPDKSPAKKTGEKEGYINYNKLMPGWTYIKDGKQGFMSADGKKDSGAVYDEVSMTANLPFFVAVDKTAALDSVEALNRYTFINSDIEVAIEGEYAHYTLVGGGNVEERYMIVVRYDGVTDDKSKAVNIEGGCNYSFAPGKKEVMFTGEWFVIDANTGKKVEGIGGNGRVIATTAFGDYIKYVDVNDGNTTKYFNVKGNQLGSYDKVSFFYDGTHLGRKDGTGYVCGTDGKVLFEYGADDYAPFQRGEGCFVGKKIVDAADGTKSYKCVVLDEKGKVISSEFEVANENAIRVSASYVFVNGILHDYKGNKLSDEKWHSWTVVDACGKEALMLKTENDEVFEMFVDKKSVVKVENDGTYEMNAGACAISKKADKTMYYSYKDKDFTVEGKGSHYLAPWALTVASAEGSDRMNLINTLNGETILSGYAHYQFGEKDGKTFVLAWKYGEDSNVHKIVGCDIFELDY